MKCTAAAQASPPRALVRDWTKQRVQSEAQAILRGPLRQVKWISHFGDRRHNFRIPLGTTKTPALQKLYREATCNARGLPIVCSVAVPDHFADIVVARIIGPTVHPGDGLPLFRDSMYDWIVPEVSRKNGETTELSFVNRNYSSAALDVTRVVTNGSVIEKRTDNSIYILTRNPQTFQDVYTQSQKDKVLIMGGENFAITPKRSDAVHIAPRRGAAGKPRVQAQG